MAADGKYAVYRRYALVDARWFKLTECLTLGAAQEYVINDDANMARRGVSPEYRVERVTSGEEDGASGTISEQGGNERQ